MTKEIFTVSQFNQIIKSYLQELGSFCVEGEVTELTITQRQGVYITLADGKSNLKVSGYAPTIKGIKLIEKGMKVLVYGTCDIYVPYGSFSLSIYRIEPEGEGALQIAYEKLKTDLENRGFFNESAKLPLPQLISKVALLTGKNSAAYSDFVKILKEGNFNANIDYYPIIVQGENSVLSIVNAIKKAIRKDYDAIVLTRGGGSLEDLRSFNAEEIVQLIFESRIPFVVGVGHEKDESICDFVADMRASTPSQCAYYLLDRNHEFLNSLDSKSEYIQSYINDLVIEIKNMIKTIHIQLTNHIDNKLTHLQQKLLSYQRLIESFNIDKILKRGFAIIKKQNQIVTKTSKLKKNDLIKILMQDGELKASVS